MRYIITSKDNCRKRRRKDNEMAQLLDLGKDGSLPSYNTHSSPLPLLHLLVLPHAEIHS